MIINEPGFYETRAGEKVEIFGILATTFGCVGTYLEADIKDSWHKSGRLYFGQECENDIVRKIEQ